MDHDLNTDGKVINPAFYPRPLSPDEVKQLHTQSCALLRGGVRIFPAIETVKE